MSDPQSTAAGDSLRVVMEGFDGNGKRERRITAEFFGFNETTARQAAGRITEAMITAASGQPAPGPDPVVQRLNEEARQNEIR